MQSLRVQKAQKAKLRATSERSENRKHWPPAPPAETASSPHRSIHQTPFPPPPSLETQAESARRDACPETATPWIRPSECESSPVAAVSLPDSLQMSTAQVARPALCRLFSPASPGTTSLCSRSSNRAAPCSLRRLPQSPR